MNDLKELISHKRLEKYGNLNENKCINFHFYNITLCESFYPSLCLLEIILRNKIDIVFSKYMTESWLEDKNFSVNDNFYKALANLSQAKKHLTKDNLIAELSFGFWTYLFCTENKKIIFDKYPTILNEIFSNSKDILKTEKILHELNQIRNYRNKVFHYGSLIIFSKNQFHCTRMHNLIYRYIKLIGGNSILKKIKEIDRFNKVYKEGIDKKIIQKP